MNTIYKIILFLIFSFASYAYARESGHSLSFWENNTLLHLLGWIFVPRIMFWFVSSISGGLLFWTGVFFIPRIMVAYWATEYYWSTNPILCVCAWIMAFAGESTEKAIVTDI